MDGYSRLIGWLKVLLPLIALGLLSTVFLLSQDRVTTSSTPFTMRDIQERVRDQQITNSLFTGVTSSGDSVHITADRMATQSLDVGAGRAEVLHAQIDTPDGTRILIDSNDGTLDVQAGIAELKGDVVMTTSTGFTLNSDLIETGLDGLDVYSPGPVHGIAPFGTLDAGNMRLNKPNGQNNPQLFFTNGVKLVYRPKD